jgi:hypothetical protein
METKMFFPEVYEMADLTHLDTPKRVGLLGLLAYNERRKFLKDVMNIGLFVGLGPVLLEACEEDNIDTFSVQDFIFPLWTSISNSESENNVFKIVFSRELDIDTISESVSFTPEVDFSVGPYYATSSDKTLAKTNTIVVHGAKGTLDRIYFKDETNYKITLKGTLKSVDGELLDGNKDGNPGTDYSKEFTIPSGSNPRLIVTECNLPDWPNVKSGQSAKNEITIKFNDYIAADSVNNVVSFEPAVDFLAYAITETGSDYNANRASGIVIHGKEGSLARIFFTPGQTYTLKIKGTVKSTSGIYLDGNDNGSPGDYYTKQFTVPVGYNAFPTFSLHEPYKITNYGSPDEYVKRFEVYFDDVMDSDSLENAVSISPAISHSLHFSTDAGSFSALYLMTISGPSSKTDDLDMTPGSKYTVKIKGTAKSKHNQPIDGNSDGIGGDDYSYLYNVPTDFDDPGCSIYSCTCEGNTCACQTNTCTCVGFYCSCQFEGCTLYGIY